jgi:ribosomal protection tetracycline resistance protein
MKSLNIGILAHVDAGKTSLTERLLFNNGVIKTLGSVDTGNTQTDSMALERQRGITIKSAVASFTVGNLKINLIDTPGHPDFIAEVERALSVLDAVVLVISAVEGVQPQTRILVRTLKRLHIPMLIFVNKIDRGGARYESLLRDITDKLALDIVPMGEIRNLGTRSAGFVVYDLDGERKAELASHTKKALKNPVFFGSAITGAGIEAVISGIVEFLPAAQGNMDEPTSGSVFKIERGRAGEKIAYVCMFSGSIQTRTKLSYGSDKSSKVTSISVFDKGLIVERSHIVAGEIGKLWGLMTQKLATR